ncbi:MAG: GNAT family N-acetyltransferase [Verrucomicrobiales bacterium]|nr:GNAT family N-acetyltransferase [Verrucomicrobiales bacterium]
MIIRRNDPRDFREFAELNIEWIREFHEVEASDRAMYYFPERYAEAGNSIFAAVEGGEVVGVCALKRDADGGWELTKMAVDREVRGRGIGRELMDVVEGYARDELGVERIYLISNTVHAAAIRLYRRSGWVVTFEGPHPRYARANIGMEKGF